MALMDIELHARVTWSGLADISDTETLFLDTVEHEGKRFKKQSILDIKKDTHISQRKPSSTHTSPLATHQVLKMDSWRANA